MSRSMLDDFVDEKGCNYTHIQQRHVYYQQGLPTHNPALHTRLISLHYLCAKRSLQQNKSHRNGQAL